MTPCEDRRISEAYLKALEEVAQKRAAEVIESGILGKVDALDGTINQVAAFAQDLIVKDAAANGLALLEGEPGVSLFVFDTTFKGRKRTMVGISYKAKKTDTGVQDRLFIAGQPKKMTAETTKGKPTPVVQTLDSIVEEAHRDIASNLAKYGKGGLGDSDRPTYRGELQVAGYGEIGYGLTVISLGAIADYPKSLRLDIGRYIKPSPGEVSTLKIADAGKRVDLSALNSKRITAELELVCSGQPSGANELVSAVEQDATNLYNARKDQLEKLGYKPGEVDKLLKRKTAINVAIIDRLGEGYTIEGFINLQTKAIFRDREISGAGWYAVVKKGQDLFWIGDEYETHRLGTDKLSKRPEIHNDSPNNGPLAFECMDRAAIIKIGCDKQTLLSETYPATLVANQMANGVGRLEVGVTLIDNRTLVGMDIYWLISDDKEITRWAGLGKLSDPNNSIKTQVTRCKRLGALLEGLEKTYGLNVADQEEAIDAK